MAGVLKKFRRRCRDRYGQFVLRVGDNKRHVPNGQADLINLPVSDLARATAFYQAIGAVKNAQFSDDTASCMVFSDTIHAMLITYERYR